MTVPDQYTEALIEQHLAEMSDTEFAALVQRTRPPETSSTEG